MAFQEKDVCKGSARSIPGFNVTQAMLEGSELWLKCGGHSAAGGFSFKKENITSIRKELCLFAQKIKSQKPSLWESKISFDCQLPSSLLKLDLLTHLNRMRPYGHSFKEPVFLLEAQVTKVIFYEDKLAKNPKHTACFVETEHGSFKLMFFYQYTKLKSTTRARFLIKVQKNVWNGRLNLSLLAEDFETLD